MDIRVSSEETNLYFLKSRYYDSEVGRFISPDSVDFIAPYSFFGFNLYAYCKNNPVMFVDPNGHFPWLILTALLLLVYHQYLNGVKDHIMKDLGKLLQMYLVESQVELIHNQMLIAVIGI